MLDLTTPQLASRAFYDAFMRRDLDAMMAVWSKEPDTVCIHPMSDRLVGRAAIRNSWREIFLHAPEIAFRNRGSRIVTGTDLALETVLEVIHLHGQERAQPAMAASNAFRREESGWRMILHQAGPMGEQAEEPVGGHAVH